MDQLCYPWIDASSTDETNILRYCKRVCWHWSKLPFEGTGPQRPPIVSEQTCCLMKTTRSSSNTSTHKRDLWDADNAGLWLNGAWVLPKSTQHTPPSGHWAPTRCYDAKNTKRAMPYMWAIIRPLTSSKLVQWTRFKVLWYWTEKMQGFSCSPHMMMGRQWKWRKRKRVHL